MRHCPKQKQTAKAVKVLTATSKFLPTLPFPLVKLLHVFDFTAAYEKNIVLLPKPDQGLTKLTDPKAVLKED